MNKWLVLILLGAAFGLGSLVGVLTYNFFVGGNSEPSADISEVAPTLSLDAPTPTPRTFEFDTLNGKLDMLSTQIAAQNEQITMLSTVVAAAPQQSAPLATVEVQDAAPITTEEAMIEPLATEAAIAQPLATEAAESDAVATGDLPERALFRISSDESEARFRIDEKLMGNPNEVVGITSQVGGDIIVNYQNPSLSQVGTIVINARTIKTDNEFRNQSIRGQILESSKDEYEFINFTPTEILNAPSEPVEVGETVNFQVVGDLQIKDVTRSVTFDIALTAAAVDRIEGLASVTVLYADFGLRINAPPTVSEIGDSVILELDFVASRVEE